MHGTVLPVAFRASPAQRPALVLGISESTDDDAVGGGPGRQVARPSPASELREARVSGGMAAGLGQGRPTRVVSTAIGR